jgi:hypothetical protein
MMNSEASSRDPRIETACDKSCVSAARSLSSQSSPAMSAGQNHLYNKLFPVECRSIHRAGDERFALGHDGPILSQIKTLRRG